jgi:hypothetical protein
MGLLNFEYIGIDNFRFCFIYIVKQQNAFDLVFYAHEPVHNVLEAWIYITWGSWRGLGPGIPEFFGPCEMATSR